MALLLPSTRHSIMLRMTEPLAPSAHAAKLKDWAALSVAYGCGLRVSEVAHLKVTDIDSARMLIRVEQGKGRKDRYVMLSADLLDLLRQWWLVKRSRGWLCGAGMTGCPTLVDRPEVRRPGTCRSGLAARPPAPPWERAGVGRASRARRTHPRCGGHLERSRRRRGHTPCLRKSTGPTGPQMLPPRGQTFGFCGRSACQGRGS